MKSVIFLADGMADVPAPELGGKTPLEYADTPAMDFIARSGRNGTFLTLPPGLPTSSDVANMSVLGYYPEQNYPGRGPIEAASRGIELAPDDIAWRCNLVYVSSDGVLRDFSAGHIDNECSNRIMTDLQKEFGSDKITFYPGVSYRNLLVLHGKEFSDRIDYHKPDSSQDMPIAELGLRPMNEQARHTVEFLADIERAAAEFLANHPLNADKSSPYASHIWPWSPGHRPNIESFSHRYSAKTGAVISAVDVIKGLGRASGMQVINVPGATGYLDTNYDGKVQAALKALESYDFVYLHVEAIDECSHEGDLRKKLQAITDFDSRIVAPVMRALAGEEVRYAVLPDHPVPFKLRQHTTDPVPLAICGAGIEPDDIPYYSEIQALQGSLGLLRGDELMKMVLGLNC